MRRQIHHTYIMEGDESIIDRPPGHTSLTFSSTSSWQQKFASCLHPGLKTKNYLTWLFYIVSILLYGAFYTYSLYFDFSNDPAFLVLTLLGIICAVYVVLGTFHGERIRDWCTSVEQLSVARKTTKVLAWLLPIGVIVGTAVFSVVDSINEPTRLISAAGLVFIIFLAFLCSTNPSKIKWQPVISGVAVQLVLGLVILRWPVGYDAFRWLGSQIATFLSYSDVGARAVFGDSFTDHPTAMQSMPVAVYFGAVSSVLYYLGVLQVAIKAVGRVIQAAMATGTIESFVAASNIFLGPTESVLTVAPHLSQMTKAELHTVLTSGFSTISGGVLSMYISFGASPTHLVTASVMSAPAALAISRVILPETQVSKIASARDIVFDKPTEKTLVEAISRGASGCIRMVGYMMANMIAFTALVEFLNKTLQWFGNRAGMKQLTFEVVCGYVLWPIAFLLGVDSQDCATVGQLIGTAIILNSFFSYITLGTLIRNRGTGGGPTISTRSEAIVTYAICNFANLGSIGMNLGSIGALAPSKRSVLAQVALRALISGNMASFMTAAVSGLLFRG